MRSKLSKYEIENFWIRVYLGNNSDFINLAIDRAYRDFNRTIHGLKKLQTKEKYSTLKKTIRNSVNEITKEKINSQKDYDNWHFKKCKKLKSDFLTIYKFPITFGQAQKWINMTLKYLYALGDKRIQNIEINYKYFHIPIDNIVQNELEKIGIPKLKMAWSKLDSYNIYLNYQKKVRELIKDEIPMDYEFKLFNKSKL